MQGFAAVGSAIQEVFAFTVITSLRSVKSGEKLPGTHATLSTLASLGYCVYVHSSPETALGILYGFSIRDQERRIARVYTNLKGVYEAWLCRTKNRPRPSARDSIINAKL